MASPIDGNPAPALHESTAATWRFAAVLTALFVALTVPRLLLHELWRDEAWLWLVVSESTSFGELFEALGRSGQGYLFPLLCCLVRHFTPSPLGMQLLNLLVAAGAALAFLRWAPLGRLERALFVFGYFPFFEYAVISRHYAAGVLLLWLVLAARERGRVGWMLGILLGLLCQTTVYGVILALAFAAGWLTDRRLAAAQGAENDRGPLVLGGAFALAGLIAGLVQLAPLPGTRFAIAWHFGWEPGRVVDVLRSAWRGLVPLPRFDLHFWNSNLLDAWPHLEAVAGALALAFVGAFLWPRKAALVSFAVGAGGLFAFGYLKYVGQLRHQGHLWILLIAALWFAGESLPRKSLWRLWSLRALLVLHCGVGVYASAMDLGHPFSNGPATAATIRRLGLEQAVLFGYREAPVSSVSLPLGRPFYSPARGVFATRPDWGPDQRELSWPEVRCAARDLARRSAADVLLVINSPLPPWPELESVASETGAIVKSEDFYLYRLRLSRLADTPPPARCPPEAR